MTPLNPAFASNLEPFVAASNASLWIHGHIHQHSDYTDRFDKGDRKSSAVIHANRKSGSIQRWSSKCNTHPVGRAVQAAACKAAEAGAIPARDSISSGIGVERHTPVFQTGIEGALPSCPSISQVNPACRQRPRTVEVMAGCRIQCAWDSFSRREHRCRSGLHRPGCGGSTPPSCRVWVANFDSEVPALNRREHGANPRRPTILPMWLSSDSSSFVNCRALPHESASLSVGPISHPW